mmetsp:Transcript_107714/g.300148  ORF Transcript_107714/g.300148 Transcript_107714/m.300148 type:complete len:134 (+) Transcript_107714:124-525(+)|eukprot:CAMPEP_0179122144 /NCGR_PEP_ID=MMETSP0796-20121207/57636_1 /TAXON_ID=73915 /ORGANISM="Pyrodinium bahamense, Strain pbaha01" /LENGTH=133 /DNA_ID=CAMNT_0020820761 /DNA_START=123 /DNA_END=524 /DNA_ORIENTATION=-
MGNIPTALCAGTDHLCCDGPGQELQPMQVTSFAAIRDDHIDKWTKDLQQDTSCGSLADMVCQRHGNVLADTPNGSIVVLDRAELEDLAIDEADQLFKGCKWIPPPGDDEASVPKADSLKGDPSVQNQSNDSES